MHQEATSRNVYMHSSSIITV